MQARRLISNRGIWKGFVKEIRFWLGLENLGELWFIPPCLVPQEAPVAFSSQVRLCFQRGRMWTSTSHHWLPSTEPSSQSQLHKCLSPMSSDDKKEQEKLFLMSVVFVLSQVHAVSGDLGQHLPGPFSNPWARRYQRIPSTPRWVHTEVAWIPNSWPQHNMGTTSLEKV